MAGGKTIRMPLKEIRKSNETELDFKILKKKWKKEEVFGK